MALLLKGALIAGKLVGLKMNVPAAGLIAGLAAGILLLLLGDLDARADEIEDRGQLMLA